MTAPVPISPNRIGGSIYSYLTNLEAGITAHAGGGQSAGYQLAAQMNRITTVATAADSTVLPKISAQVNTPGSLGWICLVDNRGSSTMQVFGRSSDTINGIATGTGIALGAGGAALFYASNYTQATDIGDWSLIASAAGGGVISSYTWATLPSAATYSGQTVRVSDVGHSGVGSSWWSDGTSWLPVNGSILLAASATAVSCPADTTEDILATYNVPAGLLGSNGSLRVTTTWTHTNSANNKQLRIRFNGPPGGSAYLNQTDTTSDIYQNQTIISNRTTGTQVGFNGAAGAYVGAVAGGAAQTTSSIDTTVLVPLNITGQKASAGETLTLERYMIELLRP